MLDFGKDSIMRKVLLALAPLWLAPLLVAAAAAQEPAN